jgi:hypothetical protein
LCASLPRVLHSGKRAFPECLPSPSAMDSTTLGEASLPRVQHSGKIFFPECPIFGTRGSKRHSGNFASRFSRESGLEVLPNTPSTDMALSSIHRWLSLLPPTTSFSQPTQMMSALLISSLFSSWITRGTLPRLAQRKNHSYLTVSFFHVYKIKYHIRAVP